VGSLLTISRFPIVATGSTADEPVPAAGTEQHLVPQQLHYGRCARSECARETCPSTTCFFYDRFFLNVIMPLTPTFFENIHGLEEGRRASWTGCSPISERTRIRCWYPATSTCCPTPATGAG